MELTPAQREQQDTVRSMRAKEMGKTTAPEAQLAAWGLKPEVTSFFSILAPYAELEEGEVPVDMAAVTEEWARMGDNADGLIIELRINDLVEERGDAVYITDLGRNALQYLF